MNSISITQSKGKGSLKHNNRMFISSNVDINRIKDNVIFKHQSLEDKYHELFSPAVNEYNAKQKRNDRLINASYFEHLFNVPASSVQAQKVLENKDKTKSFYEDIVQVGDINDCGINSDKACIVKQCLRDYYLGNDKLNICSFEKRNPNLKVFNAIMHNDEATPHLHIDYIPVATGYKRGIAVQNGYNRALEQQGFVSKTILADGKKKFVNGFSQWRENERDILRDICKYYGLNVKNKEEEENRHHTYSVKQYKEIINEANSILDDANDTVYDIISNAKETLDDAKADAQSITKQAQQTLQQAYTDNEILVNENRKIKCEIQQKRMQLKMLSDAVAKMPKRKLLSSFGSDKYEMDKNEYDDFMSAVNEVKQLSHNTLTSDEDKQAIENERKHLEQLRKEEKQRIQQQAEQFANEIIRQQVAELKEKKQEYELLIKKQKKIIISEAKILAEKQSETFSKLDNEEKKRRLERSLTEMESSMQSDENDLDFILK